MKKSLFFLSFMLMLFSACQPSTESTASETVSANPLENLPKVWRLTEYDLLDSEGSLSDSQKSSLGKRALREGYQLCFIPKNIGTSITGEIYEEFSWDYDVSKATITLKKKNGETVLSNVKIEKGEKRWTLSAVENNTAQLKLIGITELAAQLEEEPFHPINNQWRVKATAHEDEKALKSRLLNFVSHYRYLFKSSIDNPKRSFTNSKSDGIILIYKGAIGFIKEADIPTEWSYSFYDEYQAKEAYNLFKKYLNNKPIKKEAAKNWKPVNLEILTELEAKIKADINN